MLTALPYLLHFSVKVQKSFSFLNNSILSFVSAPLPINGKTKNDICRSPHHWHNDSESQSESERASADGSQSSLLPRLHTPNKDLHVDDQVHDKLDVAQAGRLVDALQRR